MSAKDFYDKLKIVTDALKNLSDIIKKHRVAILWVIAALGGLSGIMYTTTEQPVESVKPVCTHVAPAKPKPQVIKQTCKCDLKKHVKKYHE